MTIYKATRLYKLKKISKNQRNKIISLVRKGANIHYLELILIKMIKEYKNETNNN